MPRRITKYTIDVAEYEDSIALLRASGHTEEADDMQQTLIKLSIPVDTERIKVLFERYNRVAIALKTADVITPTAPAA